MTSTTWRTDIAGADFLDAVLADHVQIDGHVEILDQTGATLAVLGGRAATHPGPLECTVAWESGGHVAWSVDMTLADDDLVPRSVGDLLHPLSYNQVRPWWSVRTRSGWVDVPLGTCFVEQAVPVEDGSASVATSVSGASALALVSRSLMTASAQVGGMGVGDAASSVLLAAAPWLSVTWDRSLDGTALPAGHEAGEADADPVAVAADIAAAAGAVLTEDRMGGVHIGPPRTGVSSVSLTEGPGCRATRVGGGIDLSSIYNVVTVVSGTPEDSEGAPVEPVSVTVEDDDPSSPTWVGHGVRLVHPSIQLDEVVTEAQARTIALERLEELRGATEPVSVECVPLPHVDGGDMVQVSFSRIGAVGARRVVGWSLRLGPTGGMRLELGALTDTPASAPSPPTRGGVPLDVPDPVVGRDLLHLARRGATGERVREAVVRVAPDPATGVAVVDLAGQETPVHVGSSMRALSVGERVSVVRTGASWVVVASRGWVPPPSLARTGTGLAEVSTDACTQAIRVRNRLNDMIPRIDALYGALYEQRLAKENP